ASATDAKYPSALAVKGFVEGKATDLSNSISTLSSSVTNLSNTTNTNLATKENAITVGTVGQYYRGDKTWATLTKDVVGLDKVNNTSDAEKPISTAAQLALNDKENTSNKSVDITVDGASDVKYVSAKAVKSYVDLQIGSLNTSVGTVKENAIMLGTTSQYFRGDKTWASMDKSAVGLSNVDNTSDANKPISTATQTALDAKESSTNKSISITTDGASDVKYTSAKAVKTYVDSQISTLNTSIGTAKENAISAGTAGQYFTGTKTWATLDKAAVGLGNVDNTSDANKPISTATQTALNAKEGTITAGTAGQYFTGTKTWATLDKAAVGLGNVENTSDANKPISTATQTALDAKAALASPALTGTPTAPTAASGTNTTQIATTAFVQAAVTASATSDASTSAKGIVKLAGDLSGTADLPTIGDGKVTTEKIADQAITVAKLEFGLGNAGSILMSNGTTAIWITEVYQFLSTKGDNSSKTFNLPFKYAGGMIKVWTSTSSNSKSTVTIPNIKGSDFTVAQDGNSITFSNAPGNNTYILVNYYK
ncbi:MAG: hypothetical protein RI995_1084, partial [Bacteroidota bacterium]